MAILDFIKNRGQGQAVSGPAAQPTEAPNLAPAQRDVAKVVPASELAKAREVGERLKKASMHIGGQGAAGETGSNAALLQNQNNQDKTQVAMSPTDRFAGKTALQQRSRGWER